MSLYPGEFLKFIMRWTENIGPVHHLLKKRTPDSRMADVELAVRFLAFKDQDVIYQGDLKRFLDDICKKYNASFSNAEFVEAVESNLDQMNAGIEAGMEIFGDSRFCRKFEGNHFETRFNRAIFDVMVGMLSLSDFRLWARANQDTVVAEYKGLFESDEFRRSIETTTKSKEATRTRFAKAYSTFSSISGVNLPLPAIAD